MAIGLISACGLCKEEVIAKSAGLDILAHSSARTGRGEREKGKMWMWKRSKGKMKKFRCEFTSWPALKPTLIKWRRMHTHISAGQLARPRTNISKSADTSRSSSASCQILSTFASPRLLSLQNVTYCSSSSYCLTVDLKYIEKDFPSLFCVQNVKGSLD